MRPVDAVLPVLPVLPYEGTVRVLSMVAALIVIAGIVAITYLLSRILD
jgi:hypothetical protein